MIATRLKDAGKKIVKRDTIKESTTESFSNQNIEIIDLRENLGLKTNLINKEKISRSESCI